MAMGPRAVHVSAARRERVLRVNLDDDGDDGDDDGDDGDDGDDDDDDDDDE